MKLKYFVILGFCIFWIVVVFLASWLDRTPISAQEKLEYPQRMLTFEESPRRVMTQDSVLVIFSARKVLELLKEYQASCEITEGITVTYRWVGMKLINDTLSTPQKQMTLEGLIDWLENVKLKGSN